MTDPFNGENLPPFLPKTTYIDVRGREEHEAFLKDPQKCKEHGLDIVFETARYLKRWGGWLKDEETD